MMSGEGAGGEREKRYVQIAKKACLDSGGLFLQLRKIFPLLCLD